MLDVFGASALDTVGAATDPPRLACRRFAVEQASSWPPRPVPVGDPLPHASPGPPLLVTSLQTSQCPSGLVGDLHLEVAGTSWSAAWASLRKNRLAAVASRRGCDTVSRTRPEGASMSGSPRGSLFAALKAAAVASIRLGVGARCGLRAGGSGSGSRRSGGCRTARPRCCRLPLTRWCYPLRRAPLRARTRRR